MTAAMVAAALVTGACEQTTEDASTPDRPTAGQGHGAPLASKPGELDRSCDAEGATQACGARDGALQYCDVADYEIGDLEWGPCLSDVECEPGDEYDCFDGEEAEEFGNPRASCLLIEGIPQWDEEACNTPLVLAFGPGPVQMMTAGSATFDISGAGQCITTDWPTSATPWLAIDLDRSGSIDGGHELFGSGTILGSGAHAKNGFAALSELDSNADGQISERDARWSELVLWSDIDGDRRSTMWELEPLANRGVESIGLDYQTGRDCDERGNCTREHARFAFEAAGEHAAGQVLDLYMACH